MLNNLFRRSLYIKIYANHFMIRRLKDQHEIVIHATEAFTTRRLLVGEFSKAEKCLKEGMVKIYASRWFSPAPVVLIQPMVMTEGGLSELEERALQELAIAAGARKVLVWVGDMLADQEVVSKLKILQ